MYGAGLMLLANAKVPPPTIVTTVKVFKIDFPIPFKIFYILGLLNFILMFILYNLLLK